MNNLSFPCYSNKDFLFGKSLFLGGFHFPTITNTVTELFTPINVIGFFQEDIHTACDRQTTDFELGLNGEELVSCEENTRYSWSQDGGAFIVTDEPRISFDVPVSEISTDGSNSPNPHTVRVIIEKLDPINGWIQVEDLTHTYYIGYDAPPFDCNGWLPGLGKIAANNNKNSEFVIYPNPANTEFSIKSSEKVEQVIITNSLGQVLLTTNKNKSISIESFATGIYFVTIILQNEEVKTQKLIIN